MGCFEVWEVKVGQNEQQCYRKLKQLDETTTPYARAMACQLALGEAWEEDGQTQAGDDEVEEWGRGENRAEVG